MKDRPESDLFATDYSPWSWNIDYEVASFGKIKLEYCSLEEFKRYSARDFELLNELKEHFAALREEKISETAEER